MPKAKPKPKPAPADPLATIPPHVLDRVLVILVTVRSRAEALEILRTYDKLALSPEQAEAAVDEAARRIKLASQLDYDNELGTAHARLNDLYTKSVNFADLKTALAAQKEINKLAQLYRKDGPAPTSQADDDSDDVAGELAEARAHLAPLVDADDLTPLSEIARRVVALFITK